MRIKEALARRFFSKEIDRLAAQRANKETEEEEGWRSLSIYKRDLPAVTFERQLSVAFWLYRHNPIAKRIIEIIQDFVVGSGIKFFAKEDRVQEVLENFWNDPYNGWALKQFQRVAELFLYGEQIYQVFVNEANGHVRLGYIDPQNVEKVILDPENAEQPIEIKLKEKEQKLRVIRRDDDPFSETYGRLIGDVFLFQVNKISGSSRGISELFTLADWLDAYDQFVFQSLERANFLSTFIWDITIEGATEEECRLKAQELQRSPPKPGSFRVHNENTRWTAVSPDLGGVNLEQYSKVLRAIIQAGSGIPEHWLGTGEYITRATAQAMGEPTFRRLQAKQRYVQSMFEFMFKFVLDQAVIAGTLPADLDFSFTLRMPEISKTDLRTATETMSRLVQALALAAEEGWISRKAATKIFEMSMAELGFELRQTEEEKEKEEEPLEGEASVGEDILSLYSALRDKLGSAS
jgi:hypothetical protein